MQYYPWQQTQWQKLMQRIKANKLAHALLLTGSQGLGKLDFAQAFVNRLFCASAVNDQACGSCEACHLLKINHHPDLKLIAAEDGKQVISVDQIRELIAYQNLTPHSAPKKVAIVKSAERLNINAANSLLKTLEEPPESSILILVTHHPQRLLPTIRSRCQSINFTAPDAQQSLTWLLPKMNNDKRKAINLLALANNAPLKALDSADIGLLEQRNQLFESLQGISQGALNPVTVAAAWLKNDFELMCLCMTSWVVDMVRLKADQQSPVLGNPDLGDALKSLSEPIELRGLLDFYQALIGASNLKRSNINVQMILEDLLIQWVRLAR